MSCKGCQRGSNPPNHTFCSLILNCLLLPSDTWRPESKKPAALKPQGMQAKNDPTQSEQLTTICSDWVGSFNLVRAWGLEPQRIAAREPKSRMSTNSIMPANMRGRDILPLFFHMGVPLANAGAERGCAAGGGYAMIYK